MKKKIRHILGRKIKPLLIRIIAPMLNANNVFSFTALLFLLRFQNFTTIRWQTEVYSNNFLSTRVANNPENPFNHLPRLVNKYLTSELKYISKIYFRCRMDFTDLKSNDFTGHHMRLINNFPLVDSTNQTIVHDYKKVLSTIKSKFGSYNCKRENILKTNRKRKYKILYFCNYMFYDDYNALQSINLHDSTNFAVEVFQNTSICNKAKESGLKILNSYEELKKKYYDFVIDCNGFFNIEKSLYALGKRIGDFQIAVFNDLISIKLPHIDYIGSYDYLTEGLDPKYFLSLTNETIIPTIPPPTMQLPTKLPVSKNGYVLFGNTASPKKINNSIVQLWSELLKNVKKSKIRFIHPQYTILHNKLYIINLFKKYGIKEDRIEFAAIGGYPNYLYELAKVDIHLGYYPLVGSRVLTQSLAEGLFSVNLENPDHVYSKLSGLFASALDLKKYTTQDPKKYVEICLELAENPKLILPQRKKIRQEIKDFNTKHPDYFVRELETKLLKLVND